VERRGAEGFTAVEMALAAGAVAVALGGAAALILLRRRGRGGRPSHVEAELVSPESLDSTDRQILEALKRRGGEALQSELQRELDLPKSTLWRRLRRLESMGYIEVVREGKTNRVRLLRDPEKGSE
jgi:uncharacterized membrane protein